MLLKEVSDKRIQVLRDYVELSARLLKLKGLIHYKTITSSWTVFDTLKNQGNL